MKSIIRPSLNYNERKNGVKPDMLIVHYTGMPSAEDALARLCNAEAEVSCHYVIDEDGLLYSLVDEGQRAWHAGVSSWQGRTDINTHSIGIELVNPGHEWGYRAFPATQIDALVALAHDIRSRHAILPQMILGHSDIAPGRKQDPGELFPWALLAENGLGLWSEPYPVGGGRFFQRGDSGQPVEALQAMFALFGYNVSVTGQFDAQTEAVVIAFQRHYRPERIDGIADESTIISLHNLLKLIQ